MNNLSIKIHHPTLDESYELSYWDSQDRFWLKRDDGEGMAFKSEELFNIFDKFFKENH